MTTSLPEATVALEGSVQDDGLPLGGTLDVRWFYCGRSDRPPDRRADFRGPGVAHDDGHVPRRGHVHPQARGLGLPPLEQRFPDGHGPPGQPGSGGERRARPRGRASGEDRVARRFGLGRRPAVRQRAAAGLDRRQRARGRSPSATRPRRPPTRPCRGRQPTSYASRPRTAPCSSSDDVTVELEAENRAPVVDAGSRRARPSPWSPRWPGR